MRLRRQGLTLLLVLVLCLGLVSADSRDAAHATTSAKGSSAASTAASGSASVSASTSTNTGVEDGVSDSVAALLKDGEAAEQQAEAEAEGKLDVSAANLASTSTALTTTTDASTDSTATVSTSTALTTTTDASASDSATTLLYSEATTDVSAPTDVMFGRTPESGSPWRQYGSRGIYIDVDTRAAGFSRTPVYVCGIGGTGYHNVMWGGSSVYSPTKNGFRVYIFNPYGRLSVSTAHRNKWHINWAGTTNRKYGGTAPSAWRRYGSRGLYQDVSTRAAGMRGTAVVVTSVQGRTAHWQARGTSCTYSPKTSGFRMYVLASSSRMYPQWARSWGWQINWIATTPGRGSFKAARTSRYHWSVWPRNRASRIRTRYKLSGLGRNAVMLTTLSGSSSHWVTAGANAVVGRSGGSGWMYIERSGGTRYARRYNYQVNVIGGNPYADLVAAEIKSLTHRVTVLARASGKLGTDVNRLRNKVNGERRAAGSFKSRAAREVRAAATINRDIRALTAKRKSLTGELTALARKGRDLKRKLDNSVRGLRGSVKTLQATTTQLSNREASLVKDVEAATGQITKLGDARTGIDAQYNAVKSKIGPETLGLQQDQANFQTRSESFKTQLTAATELHTTASEQMDAVSSKLNTLKASVADLESTKSKLEEEMGIMNRAMADAKANMQSLYNEAHTARDELTGVRKEYSDKTSEYRNALDSENAEREELEHSTRLLADQVDRETTKEKEASSALARLTAESLATRTDLRKKLEAAEKAENELQIQVEVLRHVLSSLKTEVDGRKERLTATEEKVDAANQHIKEEKQLAQSLEDRRHALVGSLHALTSRAAMLKSDMRSEAEAKTRLEAAVQKKETELRVAKVREKNALTGNQIVRVVNQVLGSGGGGGGGASGTAGGAAGSGSAQQQQQQQQQQAPAPPQPQQPSPTGQAPAAGGKTLPIVPTTDATLVSSVSGTSANTVVVQQSTADVSQVNGDSQQAADGSR